MGLHKTSVLILLIILLLGAAACRPENNAHLLAFSDLPEYTQTPTPFQPAVNTPAWAPTAGAIKAAAKPVIVQTPIYFLQQMPEGEVNLLLLGSDHRNSPDYRTDTILLMSLNPQNGSVSVVSFPRDLWVELPDVGDQRINTAMEFGGFPLLASTFQKNFGVRPTYYVMTNFDGFVTLIDGLGGVTLTAGGTLRDQCDLPQADRYGACTVTEGETVHMDGATALWYVRSRHTSSDFDRLRRAQEVLLGVTRKLLKPGFAMKLPTLFSKFESTVETNMDFSTMVSFLPLVPIVLDDTSRIHLFTLGVGAVKDWTAPEGERVLKPNLDVIKWIVYQAIHPQ
jgi:polyisoprenyl-teichoic acid--peptidoglycan teichoic acid transferase